MITEFAQHLDFHLLTDQAPFLKQEMHVFSNLKRFMHSVFKFTRDWYEAGMKLTIALDAA